MIRHVFFDAAGTLFELAEPVGDTYARIGRRHGLHRDAAALEARFRAAWRNQPAPEHPPGKPPADDDRSWWRSVVRATFSEDSMPLDDLPFESLFDELYAHYAQPSAWRLFPDTAPALEALHRRFHLHLLSNFDQRLSPIIDGLGIAPHFASLTLSSQAGVSKPHPRIFAHALSLAHATASECLHVGDEEKADLLGATASGFHGWLLRRPQMTLSDLAKKLLADDYSGLHPPAK